MKLRQTMLLMGKDSSSISLLFSCCIDASVQVLLRKINAVFTD